MFGNKNIYIRFNFDDNHEQNIYLSVIYFNGFYFNTMSFDFEYASRFWVGYSCITYIIFNYLVRVNNEPIYMSTLNFNKYSLTFD